MGKDFIGSKSLYDQIKQIEELQKKRSVKEIVKIVSCISIAIISIILTCFICFVIYKNGLSAESVLAVLLAFFSIFISIFFYFKADETSNKFYDSSYGFMKDQSNLLGRIEERFGEKFENLTSKIDHLNTSTASKEVQLDDKQNEIAKTFYEAFDNIKQENSEQISQYKEQLQQKIDEYQKLRDELNCIRNESQYLRSSVDFNRNEIIHNNGIYRKIDSFLDKLSRKEMMYILNNKELEKTTRAYQLARCYQLCDDDGILSPIVREAIGNAAMSRVPRDSCS